MYLHGRMTSGEDSTFCALIALLDKTDEVLLGDAEECYKILKSNFFSSNAVQSLSHVLAMCAAITASAAATANNN